MVVRLDKELEALGYDNSREEFEDIVQEVFAVFCPLYTDEDLLKRPLEAEQYCNIVRKRTSNNIPDHIILGALINLRKQGKRSHLEN